MPTREFHLAASTDTETAQNVGGAGGLLVDGDDAVINYLVREADGETPLDLSASGVSLSWVFDVDGTDEITKSTGSGVTLARASAGVVEVTLTSSDTSGAPTDTEGNIELVLTDDGSGNTVTLARGAMTITSGYN